MTNVDQVEEGVRAPFEVITFASEAHGSIARIRMPMPSKGATKVGWNPVVIHAENCTAARQKAEDFYWSERERLAGSAERRAAGRARAAKTRSRATGAA